MQNTYCNEDIVDVLTGREPWSEWLRLDTGRGYLSPEQELDSMANLFGIDRHDPIACHVNRFPHQITHTEHLSFYSVCLMWFNESYQPSVDRHKHEGGTDEHG